MTTYTVAAIPTVYRGRQYRSRLEAKWAAFFDLLGWQHEYEPFDLGSWSPDFLLRRNEGGNVIVEIKPITAFDDSVASKMLRACAERTMLDSGEWLLLLGASPRLRGAAVQIGWAAHLSDMGGEPIAWESIALRWLPDSARPVLRPDLTVCYDAHAFSDGGPPCYWDGIITRSWHYESTLPPAYPEHTQRLWAEAASAVQWKRPGGAS